MGKQIQFFMTSKDGVRFCRHLQDISGISLIPYWVADPTSLDVINDFQSQSAGEFIFWIWNAKISPPPRLNYIKSKKKWTVDEMHSEVVELSLGLIEAGIIQKGRLWADFSGLVSDSGIERTKSDEFVKWYSMLVKWIKKEGKMISAGVYALPDALQSGLKLS